MSVNLFMEAKLADLATKVTSVETSLFLFPTLPTGISNDENFGRSVNLVEEVDTELLSSLGRGNSPTNELDARMTANAYIAARFGTDRMVIPPGVHELGAKPTAFVASPTSLVGDGTQRVRLRGSLLVTGGEVLA